MIFGLKMRKGIRSAWLAFHCLVLPSVANAEDQCTPTQISEFQTKCDQFGIPYVDLELSCVAISGGHYYCGYHSYKVIQIPDGLACQRTWIAPPSAPNPTYVGNVYTLNCSCPDKVADITDPVAQQYEDGTYSTTKPDLDHLTPATQNGLACIQQKVAALNCYMKPTPTSGYRPTAYQKHLLEVYDKWQKAKDNNDPACADTKASIAKEFKDHSRFARRPADPSVMPSNHSQLDAQGNPAGNAVDISFVPDDENIHADTIACQCNMYRPLLNMPDPTKNDPVHYQPRTCLP